MDHDTMKSMTVYIASHFTHMKMHQESICSMSPRYLTLKNLSYIIKICMSKFNSFPSEAITSPVGHDVLSITDSGSSLIPGPVLGY